MSDGLLFTIAIAPNHLLHMYFTVEAQASILARFHLALKNTGVLFLGQADMLIHHSHFFTPVTLKQRFYNKKLNLGL